MVRLIPLDKIYRSPRYQQSTPHLTAEIIYRLLVSGKMEQSENSLIMRVNADVFPTGEVVCKSNASKTRDIYYMKDGFIAEFWTTDMTLKFPDADYCEIACIHSPGGQLSELPDPIKLTLKPNETIFRINHGSNFSRKYDGDLFYSIYLNSESGSHGNLICLEDIEKRERMFERNRKSLIREDENAMKNLERKLREEGRLK